MWLPQKETKASVFSVACTFDALGVVAALVLCHIKETNFDYKTKPCFQRGGGGNTSAGDLGGLLLVFVL